MLKSVKKCSTVQFNVSEEIGEYVHRKECAVFRSDSGRQLFERVGGNALSEMLLLLRVLIRREIESPEEDLTGNISYKDVETMSGPGLVENDDNNTFVSVFVSIFGNTYGSEVALLSLISKMQSNNFCIHDDIVKDVGSGVYPVGALLNHSCDPNCAIRYLGRKQVIYAIKPIEEDSELYHCYVDPFWSREMRIQGLEKVYGFKCRCVRCVGEGFTTHPLNAGSEYKETVKVFETLVSLGEQRIEEQYASQVSCWLFMSDTTSVLDANFCKMSASLFFLCQDMGNYPDAMIFGEHCLFSYAALYTPAHPMFAYLLLNLSDVYIQLMGMDVSERKKCWKKRNLVLSSSRRNISLCLDTSCFSSGFCLSMFDDAVKLMQKRKTHGFLDSCVDFTELGIELNEKNLGAEILSLLDSYPRLMRDSMFPDRAMSKTITERVGKIYFENGSEERAFYHRLASESARLTGVRLRSYSRER